MFGQYAYDRYWITGAATVQDSIHFSGTCLLDFAKDPPSNKLYKIYGSPGEGSVSIMSDEKGIPQFYSNGCKIWNIDGNELLYGDSLNFGGSFWETQCVWLKDNYPAHYQGMLALPFPNSSAKYELFHLYADGKAYNCRSLLHTTIDMSKASGKGAVTSKNNMIMMDSLSDGISAVRHGNGRDWWVFNSVFGADYAYLSLLTPQGVQATKQVKSLGHWDGPSTAGYIIGQSVFSPDGNLFARIDLVQDSFGNNGLEIAHFDRCTGDFFCPIKIPWSSQLDHSVYPGDYQIACGVAFSPNSRFLYVSTGVQLYQFDMWAKDVANSSILVGEYDGFLSGPFPTTYFLLELAANGKIYMNGTNGFRYFHVINNPDEKGTACNFENHGFELLTVHGWSMHNFPNYRLFDFADSPCDTLGINAPDGYEVTRRNRKLQVLPNPTDDMAKVEIPVCRHGRLCVYTVLGQLLKTYNEVDDKDSILIDTNYLPAGAYFVTLFSAGEKPLTAKMIVAH